MQSKIIASVIFGTMALALYAQTNETVELGTITVEATPISKYRSDTVTTATLFDVPPEELPAVVDVLTDDFIEEIGPTDLHDLLRHQAGVFTAGGKSLQDRSPGVFTLRGFGGTEAKLDGTLGFSGAMGLFMDPVAFERVEIAKGPVGATIGGTANSMGDAQGAGGSINLVLKSPQLERSFLNLTPRAAFGAHTQRYRLGLDLNEPFNDHTGLRLPLNVEYSKPFWKVDGADWRKSFFLAPSLLWAPDENLRLGVNTTIQYTEQPAYQGIPIYRGKPLPGYNWNSNDNLPFMHDEYFGFTIQPWVEWQAASWLVLRTGAGFAFSEIEFDHISNGGSYHNFRTGAVNLYAARNYEHSGGDSLSRSKNLYQRATIKGATGDFDHTFTLQADYNRRTSQGKQYFATVNTPYDIHTWISSNYSRSDLKKFGILAQDYIAYGKWRLLAGTRYDYHKSNLGNHANSLSPRAGLSFLATDWLIPFANISLTEAPNIGRLSAPNRELTSSWRATQYEAGLRVAPVKTLWLTTSIYRIDQKNLPTAQLDGNGNATGYWDTEGENRSQGVEASLSGNISSDWSVYAAYAWNKYEDRLTGIDFDRFPPHSVTLATSYRITSGPLADCVAGFGYRYRHRYELTIRGMRIGDDFYAASSHVFDCSFDVPLRKFGLPESVTLSLALKNIFNEHYIESNRHYYQGFPGEPRLFEVALRGNF